MSRLSWGATGERIFEVGTDRGVLYLPDTPGVPWVGLISVEETSSGDPVEEYYLDGQKRLNHVPGTEFKAKLEAYAAPREFDVCDGVLSLAKGLYATQQSRSRFSLCYRTRVGNDLSGSKHSYKLHFVYNALTGPPSRNYKTASKKPTPLTLTWDIQTIPEMSTVHRPSAHYTVDARYLAEAKLQMLEDLIYGTETTDPELPTPAMLIDLTT
jgi:hypothetical protein